MRYGSVLGFLVAGLIILLTPSAVMGARKPAPLDGMLRPHLPPLTRALRKRWPHIAFAAVSHNRRTVLLYDGSALRLMDAQGGHPRKLAVDLYWDFANAMITAMSFSYRPDDKRVAVMVTLCGGEPMGATWERLWTADIASGRIRQLAEWGYRIQGRGPQTGDRRVTGWSRDGKSVVVVGTVYRGEEMPIDQKEAGTKTVLVKDAEPAKPKPKPKK